jgi:outer membrane lipoprotein-sorting protein
MGPLASILLLLNTQHSTPNASPKAIFARCEQKLKAATSLSCTVIGSVSASYRIELLLQKPHSFRETGAGVDIYCDGKTQINHLVTEKQFFRRDISKDGFDPPGPCLDGFFGNPTGATAPYFLKSTKFSMETIDGHRCAAKTTVFDSFGRGDKMTYYVDPGTGLPTGWDQVFGGTKMHFQLTNLRLNVPVPAGSFTWTPGPGITEKVITRRGGH